MTTTSAKVLYISYDGMTDPLGQSQVLPYLTQLAKHGYEISILSCEKPGKFQQNKATIESICAAANITWHHISYTKSPPVVSTVKDVKTLTKKAIALQKKHNYDIVHCRSYIASLAGIELKRKFGVKYVFDMRGFWADERIDGNLWNPKNPLYKQVYNYFKKKEKSFLTEADAVVSLTEAAKDEMLTWGLGLARYDISVIPCCADFEHFDYNNVKSETTAKLKEDLSKMSSSPTKLAEIMGMGKPIICNLNVGDINAIFRDPAIGNAINVYAPNEWDSAIKGIPDLKLASKEKIRTKGINLFNLEKGVNEYLSIYSAILQHE